MTTIVVNRMLLVFRLQAPNNVRFDGTIIFNYILYDFCFVWCPCMAINNISVQQYNGGLLPDIMMLTQYYYHRGTL